MAKSGPAIAGEPPPPAAPGAEEPGPDALARVLAAELAGAAQVLLVGEPRAAELAALDPDVYVPAAAAAPQAGAGILALDLAPATLAAARDLARVAGTPRIHLLLSNDPARAGTDPARPVLAAARAALREAGLAVCDARRLLFGPAEAPPAAGGWRAERLEAETRELLLRCVAADDRRAVPLLEEAVARLQAQVDTLAQLEVEHARTRAAEHERARRLEELERVARRPRLADLEAEVARLAAELDRLQATRLWRLGSSWWRLRDRAASVLSGSRRAR